MSGPMAVMIRRYSMRGSVEELLARAQQQFARQLTREGQTADPAAPVVPSGILRSQAVRTGEQSLVTITVFGSQRHLHRARAAARDIQESLAEFGVQEVETRSGVIRINVVGPRLLGARPAVADGR
ncbi:hypothetical protein ACI79G_04480 [Geodermatophilus sp. SYSU D00779]